MLLLNDSRILHFRDSCSTLGAKMGVARGHRVVQTEAASEASKVVFGAAFGFVGVSDRVVHTLNVSTLSVIPWG